MTFLRRAKEDVDIFLSQSEKHKHVRQMNNQLKESPQITVKNLSQLPLGVSQYTKESTSDQPLR